MNNLNHSKEYRLRSYWFMYFLWLSLCIAVFWNFYKLWNLIDKKPEFWFLSIIEVPIESYMLVYIWHIFQDFRLCVSENGIKLVLWSRTIYATWTQIKRVKHSFFQKQLVIENPIIERRRAWWLLFDIHKWRSDDSFRLIPLSKLTWGNFDDLEFEIKKRVPHIFNEGT